MEASLRRALLIALNSRRELSRDAICRLGRDVDAWATGDASPTGGARAAAIGVARDSLSSARGLVARAPELARTVVEDAAVRGWSVIVAGDDDYPAALFELELPPPVLFCRGRLPDVPGIAIVGSRAADPYGLEATALFATALASAGLAVVSGLARGIDAAAHRAATRDPDGRTVAVLGCGLDVDYPRGAKHLRRDVERQGALLSEFPSGTPALPQHFPVRNRIIAALGVSCLVIQAAVHSGSLITARYAMDLGRDVWAVPGRIFDRRHQGTNALIRDGASPALVPGEILESLPAPVQLALRDGLAARRSARAVADGEAAATGAPRPTGGRGPRGSGSAGHSDEGTFRERLLALLTPGDPTTAESLAQRGGASVDRVLAALLDLEIDGRVGRVAGSRFVRRVSSWARL